VIGRIAVLGAISCEALAAYTLAEWIAGGYDATDRHAVRAVTFVAVALFAYQLPRVVDYLALPAPWGRVLIIYASFMVLYGALRIEFAQDLAIWDLSWAMDFLRDSQPTARAGGHAIAGAIFLFVVWARAASKSADDVDLEMVPKHFAVPFALVTVLLILSAMTGRTGEVGRAGAAFYALAVVSLAASQSARSGATIGELRAGGVTGAMLGGVAGAAAILLLLFALFVGIVGPLIGPPLGTATETLLTWILEKFFRFIFSGAGPLPQIDAGLRQLGNDQPSDPGLSEKTPLYTKVGVVLLRMLALAIVAAIVAGVIAFALRARSRSRARALGEGQVSTVGSVGEDINALLRGLFRRGERRRSASGEGVIRLYSEVLIRASDKGHDRPPGGTAAEFAPELAETFQTPVTDEITAAFQEARYAGRDPDPRTLADLERRWRDAT